MKIVLENLGKRFGSDWIFKSLNYTFSSNEHYAIIGGNGSGKSTLMKAISGGLLLTKGKLIYSKNNSMVQEEDIWNYVSYAAPYIEIIEEFTLRECIDFHFHFHPVLKDIKKNEIISVLGLEKHQHKQVKSFSSGMRQKLKLGLAFFSARPILLLDEPTSNLDAAAISWYKDMLTRFTKEKIVIIASNVEEEYGHCSERINMANYKVQL